MFTKYVHCTSELFLAIVIAFGVDYGASRAGASTSTGVGGYVQKGKGCKMPRESVEICVQTKKFELSLSG